MFVSKYLENQNLIFQENKTDVFLIFYDLK